MIGTGYTKKNDRPKLMTNGKIDHIRTGHS